jgi:hypothetical protein
MALYPSEKVEVLISGSWIDLTKDVIGTLVASGGIRGNSITDRLAQTGQLKFTLNNSESCSGGLSGYYSPGKTGSLSGWQKGIQVRVAYTYNGRTSIRFYGKILKIDVISGENSTNRICNVQAVDYFNELATFPLNLPTIQYYKRVNEATYTILTGMVNQPLLTTFSVGHEVFPTVFDFITQKTKAYTEISKLINSEMGYCYLRRDNNGENLVIENRYDRFGVSNTAKIPKNIDDCSLLISEESSPLLSEDGNNIFLDEYYQLEFINNMVNLDSDNDSNLINNLRLRVYPRKVDDTDSILFVLNYPIFIGAGQTKNNLICEFVDPTQKAVKTCGKEVVFPIVNEHIKMFTNSSGTGTNLSGSLLVSGSITSSAIVFDSIKNNSTKDGYITKIEIHGLGVYTYEPIETIFESGSSIMEYGYSETTIDLKYRESVLSVQNFGRVILSKSNTPKLIANSISLRANENEDLLNAFMFLDCGDLIYISETQTGINDYYFINGWDFKSQPGGIVDFSYTIAPADFKNNYYWKLGDPNYSKLGSSTILAP